MNREELIADSRFQDNPSRVRNASDLDRMIGEWTRTLSAQTLLNSLEAHDIPASRVYTAADCASDVQYRHRGMVREVDDPLLGKVLHCGIVPHVPEGPGEIRWTGPSIGQHTQSVLEELLGMSAQEVGVLRETGVVR
jgi:crotonobetainyl-CoA:carnitine CoA-transferase CaiB-like acyl-CoA transferase